MKLTFHRTFDARAALVWPYITVPDRMNEWSEARVEALAPGPLGRHDEAGARRAVSVRAFGLRARLVELVVEAEHPRRFVYRVTSGGGLRDHRGEITLADADVGCALHWEVSFASVVPGTARVQGAILRPRLERSLTALEAVVARGLRRSE